MRCDRDQGVDRVSLPAHDYGSACTGSGQPIHLFKTTECSFQQIVARAMSWNLLLLLSCAWIYAVLGFKASMFDNRRIGRALWQSNDEVVNYGDQEKYLSHLASNSPLPQGFEVGTIGFQFRPQEVDKLLPMNLTIIKSTEPTDSFAAMFTSNEFPGGPIRVGKDRMQNSEFLQAVVVNNKISNVCPGGCDDFGVADSEAICQKVAEEFNLPHGKRSVLPSSTGIIGWRLPVKDIIESVSSMKKMMQSTSILPAALGITTTDRYPKVRISDSNTEWRISGTAKGAGMIEPNMATMLAYILTDLDLPRTSMQKILRKAVDTSFNTISVDGDQSTSDTVLLMSSKKVKCKPEDEALFEQQLMQVCKGLSEDIVRNGEGTQHVIKVLVKGAPNDKFARDLGRAVVNSNLVKCAVSGCDPNVGRIVGAIGSFLGNYVENGHEYTKKLYISLGGVPIFEKNGFKLDVNVEKRLSDYMLESQLFDVDIPEHQRNYPPHFRTVDMVIDLGEGSGASEVIGSDLTKEYVEVNADYRS